MGIASKYNKGSAFNYQAPEDTPFTTLESLYQSNSRETVYVIHSLYINSKGMYGDSPVAIIDGYFVNLPKHLTATVKAMMEDMEFIQAVNNNSVGFYIYTYTMKGMPKGKILYSVKWLDI